MRKLLFLFACVASLNMTAGNISGFQKRSNIDYVGDGHIGHKLDIYFPSDVHTKHPVVIHIYGSAWSSNNSKGSADLNTVGVAALEAGYIFVAPNHRTFMDALYPAQINDIKAVVRYLRGNAEELGIDTSFIAVSGFSSGGHLASLMGVTRNVKDACTIGSVTMDIEGSLGGYTDQSSWVHAVCDWSGPTDASDGDCGSHIQMSQPEGMVGGCSYEQCPDKYALMGVYAYIDAGDAPTMIVHGTTDNVVPQCMGKRFYDRLVEAGIDAEWYSYNGGHGVSADFLDEMIAFFNRIKAANVHSAINQIADDRSHDPDKFIIDGVLYLVHPNGSLYDACGVKVKAVDGINQ